MILPSYPLKLSPPLTLTPWEKYQIPLCVVRLTSDSAPSVAQSVSYEHFGVGWQGRSCSEERSYLEEHGGLFWIKGQMNDRMGQVKGTCSSAPPCSHGQQQIPDGKRGRDQAHHSVSLGISRRCILVGHVTDGLLSREFALSLTRNLNIISCTCWAICLEKANVFHPKTRRQQYFKVRNQECTWPSAESVQRSLGLWSGSPSSSWSGLRAT